jgi:hypothetical protein
LDHDLNFFFPNVLTQYQPQITYLMEWISIGAAFSLVAATILTVTSGIGYLWRHGNLFFGEDVK